MTVTSSDPHQQDHKPLISKEMVHPENLLDSFMKESLFFKTK